MSWLWQIIHFCTDNFVVNYVTESIGSIWSYFGFSTTPPNVPEEVKNSVAATFPPTVAPAEESLKNLPPATPLEPIQTSTPKKDVALSSAPVVPEVLNSISTSVENTITASATQQPVPGNADAIKSPTTPEKAPNHTTVATTKKVARLAAVRVGEDVPILSHNKSSPSTALVTHGNSVTSTAITQPSYSSELSHSSPNHFGAAQPVTSNANNNNIDGPVIQAPISSISAVVSTSTIREFIQFENIQLVLAGEPVHMPQFTLHIKKPAEDSKIFSSALRIHSAIIPQLWISGLPAPFENFETMFNNKKICENSKEVVLELNNLMRQHLVDSPNALINMRLHCPEMYWNTVVNFVEKDKFWESWKNNKIDKNLLLKYVQFFIEWEHRSICGLDSSRKFHPDLAVTSLEKRTLIDWVMSAYVTQAENKSSQIK